MPEDNQNNNVVNDPPQLIPVPLITVPNEEYNKSQKIQQEKIEALKKKNKETRKKIRESKALKEPLDFLKAANEWLEDFPMRIIAAYDNFMGDAENLAQSKVDVICTWLAWKVNIAIERKRQEIIKILYEQFGCIMQGPVMKTAMAIKSFVSNPLGAVGSFASAIFGPVATVLKWMVDLITEILKLASNLSKIMAVLPPAPPNPHINYDKFQLKIKSISLAEVCSDPSSLPPPEILFPEPEKPFSKDSFAKAFETASASLKSNVKKYVLSEEDKKALSGFETNSLLEIIEKETSV